MSIVLNMKIYLLTLSSVLLNIQTLLLQKVTWLWASFISFLAAVVMPVEQFIFCAMMSVFADSFCGWAAASKRGEGFSGSKTRESLIKLLLYIVVIITFYWISKFLKFPVDVTYFVVAMVSVAEMMSILRNLGDYAGYDYEEKVRSFAPFIADFLPKSKNAKASILLLLSANMLFAQAQTQTVRPDQAPILSVLNDNNFEVYTQKGGTSIKRVGLSTLRNSIAPLALPTVTLTYTPGLSSNPVADRGRIQKGSDNNIYYIDWSGNAIRLNSSAASYTAGGGISIANGIISNTGDLSNTNELQTLSLSGQNLTLSNGGGTVTLPTGTTYTAGSGIGITGNVISANDNSSSNELQTLSLSGQNLTLSNGGGSVPLPSNTAGVGIDISAGVVSNTGDLSNTNELQTLSLSGQNLTLSNSGGTVTLPTGTTYTAGSGINFVVGGSGSTAINAIDNSVTNELQALSTNLNQISISSQNTIDFLPPFSNKAGKVLMVNSSENGLEWATQGGASYTAGTGVSIGVGNVITNTGDLSSTNELQTMSISGNNLTLSNGGGTVTIPNQSPTVVSSILSANNLTTNVGGTQFTQTINTGSNPTTLLGFDVGNAPIRVSPYSGGTGISISGSTISNTGDLSSTNELQTLSISGNSLTLNNGGGTVSLPTADGSETKLIAGDYIAITGSGTTASPYTISSADNQNLTVTGNTLSISNGNSVTLPSSPNYTAGNGIGITGNVISNSGDLSSTNELQTLSLSGKNLTLSNGGGTVTLANEIYTISEYMNEGSNTMTPGYVFHGYVYVNGGTYLATVSKNFPAGTSYILSYLTPTGTSSSIYLGTGASIITTIAGINIIELTIFTTASYDYPAEVILKLEKN